MTLSPSLPDLQRWIRWTVTRPEGVAAALARRRRRPDLLSNIGSTPRFPAVRRLAVYGDGYFSRLIECLGINFISVKNVVGEKAFNVLARAYLVRHPSTFRSVEDVGDRLADFLRGQPQTRTHPFLPDLARLEWAAHESYFADDVPPFDPGQLKNMSPADQQNARVILAPSVRMLDLDWPVVDLWISDGKLGKSRRTRWRPRPVSILVARRPDKEVRLHHLTAGQQTLLNSFKKNVPLGKAFTALARRHPQEAKPQNLSQWFTDWARTGIIHRVAVKSLVLGFALWGWVLPAGAMTPPTSAAQVSPGSSLRGLAAPSSHGVNMFLTAYQSVRGTDAEKSEIRTLSLFVDVPFRQRWSLAVDIPYRFNRATYIEPKTAQRVEDTVHGVGDATVFGRFSFWRDRQINPTREGLLILGVELPTGSIRATNAQGDRLAATQQTGSGTVDLIFGPAGVWGLSWVSLYGDVTHKMNGERAYRFGDSTRANAGLAAPLFRPIALAAEINGEFSGPDRSALTGAPGRAEDGTVLNTGGEIVFFSPALSWEVTSTTALTVGAQFPVYQNFRGTQLKSEVNYNAGLSTRFGS